MKPIDIHPRDLETVKAILAKHVPDIEVRAFGSRVKWSARETSDLDLVLITDTPLDSGRLLDLRDDFTESDLPFKVDLVDWASTKENFRKIIEQEFVVVQKGGGGPSNIPTSYSRYDVADLIQNGKLYIGDGYRAKNNELSTEGIPFARAGNIDDGFHFEGADFFPEESLPRVGNKVSRPGDVVFTSKGTVGRFAYVREGTQAFVYSPQLCFWRSLDSKKINPRYLYYWMSSGEFRAQYKSVAGQTDMAEYVSLSDQRAMHLTLPDSATQHAIAHILGTLDDKIELNRRTSETLEAMARALFKSWFIDFDPVRAKAEGSDTGLPNVIADLFPDSFEDSELGEIPKGWSVRNIGEVCDVVGGSTPSTTNTAYWKNGSFYWATPKDLSDLKVPVLLDTERQVTEIGLRQISSGLLPKGTVLLSSRAPIGYLAIAEIPVAINQGFIAMKPKGVTSKLFLLYWASGAHDEIVSRANGSTFLEINKANFRLIPIVYPRCDVMEVYDGLVEAFYQRLVCNERESRTLASIRDTLLPKLISGEIRVKDAERLMAEHA